MTPWSKIDRQTRAICLGTLRHLEGRARYLADYYRMKEGESAKSVAEAKLQEADGFAAITALVEVSDVPDLVSCPGVEHSENRTCEWCGGVGRVTTKIAAIVKEDNYRTLIRRMAGEQRTALWFLLDALIIAPEKAEQLLGVSLNHGFKHEQYVQVIMSLMDAYARGDLKDEAKALHRALM